MLHPKSSTELSRTVADLMQDIWHGRAYLKPRSYFVFRMEVSDYSDEEDKSATIFGHFLIAGSHWYFLVNEDAYGTKISNFQIEDFGGEKDPDRTHVKSYRHYAFHDLVDSIIEKKLNEAAEDAGIKNPTQYTIWNTFPICEIY